ncbi:hypothetical protein D3878_10000 [Noviherbaspirillum sedimenti]|uniref:Phytanoyl-CoA dioxygenase n=2 Tax=Noviherbaspirillum sedimenti TaxID=2320865 RepID=A0A3A3G088_9BURK|nr:hypothetical protein D3878_10000 [Noviherbaspirillum sedimenti]
MVTAPVMRRMIVSGLCALVRLRAGAQRIDQATATQVNDASRLLKADGFAALGTLFTPAQLVEIHRFLADKLLEEHGPRGRTFPLKAAPADMRMADYGLGDVLDCPHILQLANSPALLSLATQYIGCKPTLSAIGLRWSFPVDAPGEGLQAFHRDSDDWRFVKVFVYLTDVEHGCGPHVYVKGSHRAPAPLRLRTYGDEELGRAYGDEQIVSVTGPAGMGFAADTYGIHKGEVPTTRPRLLLQFQYSILPVYAYRYRPLARQGAQAFDAYINRLILR